MRATVVAEYRDFRPYQEGPNAPLFWGMNGMILIEAMVFGSLVSAYFFLRAQSPEWPTAGTDPPKLLLPTINTLVLIASSFVLHWADTGIRKGDQRRLFRGLIGASVLAAVFLILKIVEYSEVSYRWDTHAYGSIVWTIVGFHSTHVLSLMLKTVVVATLSSREYFTSERRLGVTINGIYWHFVVAVWIPLYIVLYWVPRI